MPGERAEFPQAGVFLGRGRDRLRDQAVDERHERRVVIAGTRVGRDGVEAEDHLAHDVVLGLHVGRVADAHRADAGEARQMGELLFDEVAFAADAVDRLQRSVVGHVPQERDEPFTLAQVREPAQRFHDERGVAQPAVAVVPRAFRVERFGDAGRGGGHDGAGVEILVQLEAQSRAQHGFGTERRQGAALRPRVPAGPRELEGPFDRRGVVHVGRPPGAQREETRAIDAERPAVGNRRGRDVRVQEEPLRPTEHLEALGGDGDIHDGAGVVGPRIEDRPEARRALERADEAVDLDRRIHAEAGGDAGREVDELAEPLGRANLGAQDVGVAQVGHRADRALFRHELEASAIGLVEQPREHRRAVEARQAQPVDARVRPDEREHTAVADGAVGKVGGRHPRRTSARRHASESSVPAQS